MSDLIRKEGSQFVNWIPPFLELMKEKGGSATSKEVREGIVTKLQVPEEFLCERLKSGQLRFDNQVYWAKQYLAYEEIVVTSSHGIWALTEKGLNTSLTYDGAKELVSKWVKYFADVRKNKQTGDYVDKGIFITTGSFTSQALIIEKNNTKLELIDGEKLVSMFEQKQLGVSLKTIYEPNPVFFKQYMTDKEPKDT